MKKQPANRHELAALLKAEHQKHSRNLSPRVGYVLRPLGQSQNGDPLVRSLLECKSGYSELVGVGRVWKPHPGKPLTPPPRGIRPARSLSQFRSAHVL